MSLKNLLGIFVAATFLFSSASSHAVTLVGTTSDAQGIDGLLVDGTTYNVTFVNNSYNNVYSATPPTFLCSPLCTGANDATAALISALNSLNVTDLVGLAPALGGFGSANYTALIPEVFSSGFVNSNSAACATYPSGNCIANTWGTSGGIFTDASTVYADNDYTVFAVAATTPLPAALPLFAGGLGVLGLFGVRKRRKQIAV